MRQIIAFLLSVLLVAGTLQSAAAQSMAKPSKVKLTMDRLNAMKAKWSFNKPKLKACRQDVKAKGLSGDERWFYIEDCMSKT